MYTTPTLTTQEFTDLHNGLCALRASQQLLSGILVAHSPAMSELNRAYELISKGLNRAQTADSAVMNTKIEKCNALQDQLGLSTVWSIMEAVDNMLEIPFPNAKRVVYEDHWGPDPVHANINNATWMDLWKVADAAIKSSGDRHHIFIEGFRLEGDDLILSTGS